MRNLFKKRRKIKKVINPKIEFAPLDMFVSVKAAPTDFAGATTDARGDHNGATTGVTTLYTVTGDVLVRIYGVCTTVLAGSSATLEVGVTGDPNLLIDQTTATDLGVENELWSDSTPTTIGGTLASALGPYIVPNGLDIIETTATASITSGQVYYICLYRPLSPDGLIVAA